jgi:predicted aspartyl protease
VSAIPPESPAEAGYLHKSGSPAVKIKVWGVFQASAQEFEAIIDTGFTGFLSMPMVQAFPLGLVLVGTTNVVLADGSTDTKLTALGTIGLASGQNKVGVIILEPNPTDILVGMEFLNRFERTLFLFGQRAIPSTATPVLLVKNEVVHLFLDELHRAAVQAAQAAQVAATTQVTESGSADEPSPSN